MNRSPTLLLLFCTLLITSALASDIPKKLFHLNEKVEKEIGYAQAVRIGDTLYVSGSLGAGEMPVAMRQSYDELKQTLAAHGLDFKNVVKENLYTTDLDAVKANKDIRKEYYGTECADFTDRSVFFRLLFPQLSTINFLRGHSSVGRAPALQAGSQGFESPCLQSFEEAWRQESNRREHYWMH